MEIMVKYYCHISEYMIKLNYMHYFMYFMVNIFLKNAWLTHLIMLWRLRQGYIGIFRFYSMLYLHDSALAVGFDRNEMCRASVARPVGLY